MGFKNWLIKFLGGHTDAEFSSLREKAEGLEPYKNFAESIKVYAGNYPAWKAQSEFREVMHNIGAPLTDRHLSPCGADDIPLKHAEYVDLYLGRVVDGLALVYQNEPSIERWNDKNARGGGYLKRDNNQLQTSMAGS
ncbi:TPA: hypothetical protein QHB43_004430 [Aeromonas hydrophila subsp. hydrophila]|nr:hypothetical protein [Aeromonas hydrophila subsp. hydrophila]